MTKTVRGADLRVGDVIEVWWKGGRDRITKLSPYTGLLITEFPEGAQVAEFAINTTGMTIDNEAAYEVIE